MADFDRESVLEVFSFEMNNLVDQLEKILIESESEYSEDHIREIFRIMHTIKGSAAMMLFTTISTATHAAEDLFFFLREEKPSNVDYSELTDHVLESLDFVKGELAKIESKMEVDGNPEPIVTKINDFMKKLKNQDKQNEPAPTNQPPIKAQNPPAAKGSSRHYESRIFFAEDAGMENVRAFTAINNIKPYIVNLNHEPQDIIDEASIPLIQQSGFFMEFDSVVDYEEMLNLLNKTVYVREVVLEEINNNLGDASAVANSLNNFHILMRFSEDAEMVNVRAFSAVFSLRPSCQEITHIPENLTDDSSVAVINADGLQLDIKTTLTQDELYEILNRTIYLKDMTIEEKFIQEKPPVAVSDKENSNATTSISGATDTSTNTTETKTDAVPPGYDAENKGNQAAVKKPPQQAAVINVSVNKLDQLLKSMGELVIAEAMVTQNPDLEGLQLENFQREVRQLKKIIKEVQETVMSMRMVPLSTTFFRMNRIVRDMCKHLGKEAVLEIYGENTEVDKNIIEHIGDPLMHIIRNSMDHGIEMPEERIAAGKPEKGTVVLEAKNSGSEVHIIVQDDGGGLKCDRIMDKARNNGLLRKPESEYTDKEIFQFIFMPGFSTNEQVTGYSGRGVGMDVVSSNLDVIGGSVVVDSELGEGSTFTLKIPLTLAIMEGMIVKMAGAKYTIPIVSIRDSFRPKLEDIFTDPSGNEMITVREEHFNIVRLNEFFGIEGNVKKTEEGIMMVIENGDDSICLFVDELLGEQQVVAKSIPKYIKKIRGISNCTLLGNGDISLIVDVTGFFDR